MWNKETCQSCREGEWERRENNGGDETNQGTIYVCMEMSQ
jgi:hypothetical protein